ncbi:c-type cytochrome [Paenibacillus hodogayensis]|uniref:C-type cytochrome n=1 Tax=Paenibacillus hodogayensis TaxID=279208 RepID=A0ABV5W5X9_9BACL
MNKRMAIVATALAVCVPLAGCGSRSASGVTGERDGSGESIPAVRAEALYKANCIACHGAELEGGVGPNLQKVGGRQGQPAIASQIRQGGKKMPPFRASLSDEEVETLASWLASRK